MLEAIADPPARSCCSPASKTGMLQFQWVAPDRFTSRAHARAD